MGEPVDPASLRIPGDMIVRNLPEPDEKLLRIVRLLCFGSSGSEHEPCQVGTAREIERTHKAPASLGSEYDTVLQEWKLDPDHDAGGETVQLRHEGGRRAMSEIKAAEVRRAYGSPVSRQNDEIAWDRFVYTFRCQFCTLDVRMQDGGWNTGLFKTVRNLEAVGELSGVPVWEAPVRVLEAPPPTWRANHPR